MSFFRKNIKGFTLIELLVGVSISVIVGNAVFNFMSSTFSSEKYLERSFIAEGDAKSILRNLIAELRKMDYSEAGAYPISSAAANSLVFFSDINFDGKTERLRYFLDGNVLKRGIISPQGFPAVYDLGTERLSNAVESVVSGSEIFLYYDNSFNGEGASLTEPINIAVVKMVSINIPVELNGRNNGSTIYNITSQVSLRNLKDSI